MFIFETAIVTAGVVAIAFMFLTYKLIVKGRK